MKRIAWLIVITIACGATWAHANSVVYNVSVRIPAIVGINVPPFDDPEREREYNLKHNIVTTSEPDGFKMESVETITQELMRDDQRIVLTTMVAK